MSGIDNDPVFELVLDDPDVGMTEAEIVAFLNFTGTGVPVLTAAAGEIHTSAMIALVPSDNDIGRIVMDEGGEEPTDLHLTLSYLGEAADIPEEMQARIIYGAQSLASVFTPIIAEGFSINIFNPQGDEPCIVMGVGNRGGDALVDMHSSVQSMLRGLGGSFPDNHGPWVPHVTLAYTNNPALALDLLDRTGPIEFDRLRVAFGGIVADFPLGEPITAAFWKSHEHPRDEDGQFARTAFSKRVKKAERGKDAIKAVPRSDSGHHAFMLAGRRYQTGLDVKINAHLRSGEPIESAGHADGGSYTPYMIMNDLKELLDFSVSKKDIVVHRGIKDPSSIFEDSWNPDGDNTGLTWIDKGFASTSVSEDVSKDLFADGSTMMRIVVPKGTHAVHLPPTEQLAEDELEILLNRGLKYRIVTDHGVDPTTSLRNLDVEVVPQEGK